MKFPFTHQLLFVAALLLGSWLFYERTEAGAAGPLIRSARSGAWSSPTTWEGGKLPGVRARVLIRPGHTVLYDQNDGPLLRAVHVAGTLTFATDKDTRMDVGLLRIEDSEEAADDGFAMTHAMPMHGDSPRAALFVGSADKPIEAGHTALIRLTYIEGTDKNSLPALICAGGQMELHGAPLNHTWVKLGADAKAGDDVVTLDSEVAGWKAGDKILITATHSAKGTSGTRRPGKNAVEVETEERTLRAVENTKLTLDAPLQFAHRGHGELRGNIANLSRNVVVESADPAGVRGHTMYHRDSAGSISYAEFRHLGKEGVLGRYSLHFHLAGNSMRGSSVVGASIWDSANRWLTIHGTNYLLVRDCVGYQSVGHGFFLEDGTEIYNHFDHNLAIQAFVGKKLPGQILPFDANEGAGFWWANSFNSFTANATCENDRYGYRFEATPTSAFKPALSLQFPDGQRLTVDIRTLPFVRFDDNEAMCDGRYGFNLGEGVNRQGPDPRHPFIVHNMKIGQVHYAFRPQSPSVLVENMLIAGADYGVYHPNYDNHVYRNLHITDVLSEPFNRGHDDDSIQYGNLTVDGLTFEGIRYDSIPLIQISDTNPSLKAETHIRNLKIIRPADDGKRAIVNLGGGARPEPKTPLCVPIYIHDYFGEGRHAKIVSTKSKHLELDNLKYRSEPPLTGDASRVAEVHGIDFPQLLDPVDDLPPGTIITSVSQPAKGTLLVKGCAIDNGDIARILVNGKAARATAPNFADWEITLTGLEPGELLVRAHGVDAGGVVEPAPHRVRVLIR